VKTRIPDNQHYERGTAFSFEGVFKYAVKPNGLLVWGSHIFYDAYADSVDETTEGLQFYRVRDMTPSPR